MRVTDRITPWIDAAIEKYAEGEEVQWEAALTPGENNTPCLMIVMWIGGAELGDHLYGSWLLDNPPAQAFEARIEMTVKDFLGQLFEGRSNLLAQRAEGLQRESVAPEADLPLAPPQRGAQRPSGLYIP